MYNFRFVRCNSEKGLLLPSASFSLFQLRDQASFNTEAEFACSQFTTSQFLSEVKFRYNWRNYTVVKLSIFWHCNSCAQETCSCLVTLAVTTRVHWIVVDVLYLPSCCVQYKCEPSLCQKWHQLDGSILHFLSLDNFTKCTNNSR